MSEVPLHVKQRFAFVVARCALALSLTTACAGLAVHADELRTTIAGVNVALTLESVVAQGAEFSRVATLTLKDATTGSAVAGARPAAWMQLRRSEQTADEMSCEMKAKQLSSGSLGARADADLNTYRLLTLNEDKTVAFINPFVRLNNSRLEAIVQLPSQGFDWVISARTQRLFVTLRDGGQVAVIDLSKRTLVRVIDVGFGSKPTRILYDHDSDIVWVGLDGAKAVVALNTQTLETLARLPTGEGLHTLALAPNTRSMFVTNSGDNTVSVIDRVALKVVANIPVATSPVSVVWSEAAERAVVTSIGAGELSLIDAERMEVAGRIKLAPGAIQTTLFDDGRFGLTANHRNSTVSLVDLASNRVLAASAVSAQPDQIVLTRQFAFVRGQKTAQVTMINLGEARAGKLAVSQISMGRTAPGDVDAGVNVANAMAIAPEGNGIYLANAADQTVYRYTEGLMAANGSFSNYRRAARGVLIHDASLAERELGVFVAPVSALQPGRYDVVVRNARPSLIACFVATIAGQIVTSTSGSGAVARASIRSFNKINAREFDVAINIDQRDERVIPADAILLVMSTRTGYQRRLRLVADTTSNSLTARVSLPQELAPASLIWMVEAPSLGLSFSGGKVEPISLDAQGLRMEAAK